MSMDSKSVYRQLKIPQYAIQNMQDIYNMSFKCTEYNINSNFHPVKIVLMYTIIIHMNQMMRHNNIVQDCQWMKMTRQ